MAATEGSGGAMAATASSLQRLKALGNSPDLNSQLREAQYLCNHPARADMVLKWLLEQMDIRPGASGERKVWELLAFASRLLSPARLATLLGPVKLFGIVESAYSRKDEDSQVLYQSIASTFTLLLDLAAGERGAPLLAYLSADASDAASFLAVGLKWSMSVSQYDLLGPALQIWHLRVPGSDHVEAFAKYCLAAASESVVVLGTLSRPVAVTPEGASSKSLKRRRGEKDVIGSHLLDLESLLAKHVFMPARTAFFDGQELRKGSRKAVQPDVLRLDGRLAPLASLYSSQNLAALLDIALRCSPAMTPRQKLKEGPWLEALFLALLKVAPDTNTQSFRKALRSMLEVVRRRQPILSTGFLRSLLVSHAKSDTDAVSESTGRHIDWKLIEEVIRFDARVYTNVEAARALFDDISDAVLVSAMQRDLAHETTKSYFGRPIVSRSNTIIVPIMQAFAQDRRILTFIELWVEQLLKAWPDTVLPVWFELDTSFGKLVEEHLTEHEIAKLIDEHGKALISKSGVQGHENLGAALLKITASSTVLSALLNGIRTPELLDGLWPRFDDLFRALLLASKQHSIAKIAKTTDRIPCPQLWILLERLLGLWFPLWATEHASEDSIEKWIKGDSDKASNAKVTFPHHVSQNLPTQWAAVVLSSRLVKPLEHLIETTHKDKDASVLARHAAACAESWLIALCSLTHSYTRREQSGEILDSIARAMPLERLGSFLRHPKAFDFLSDSRRNDSLSQWLGDTVGAGELKADRREEEMKWIRGVVDTALAKSHADVIEQIVRITLTWLPPHYTDRDVHLGESPANVACSKLGLDILLELPTAALKMSQRERILDAVATLEHSHLEGEEILQRRLLVMIKLLELPCPGSKILTDSSILWRLANPEHQRGGIGLWSRYHATPKLQRLLERLTELVVTHLLAAQTQDEPAAMISALYDVAFSIIEHAPVHGGGEGAPRALHIIMPLLSNMIRLRKDLAARCIDQAALNAFADGLLQKCSEAVKKNDLNNDLSAQLGLKMVLDALLCVPTAILAADSHRKMLVIAIDLVEILGPKPEPSASKTSSADARKSLLVRCLKVLCLKDLNHDAESLVKVARLTIFLLDYQLDPKDHVSVLDAMEKGLSISESRSRLQLLQHYLQASSSLPATRLLRTTLSSLTREDFEGSAASPSRTGQAIFEKVLVIAKQADNLATARAACDCIITILRQKPFMTNQYTIEAMVATLKHLTQHGPHLTILYIDICSILTALLQQHRSRLYDRMHIMVNLLQTLITPFFIQKPPLSSSPSSSSPPSKQLQPHHARLLSRNLLLLCNPPHHHRHSNSNSNTTTTKSELVDEARKAQARIGQYVPYALHHYCAQVLTGALAEGAQEALMPGLWAMMEAMEVSSDQEGIKTLSAAMSNSERAVLRGLYEEYKSFGKWRGG